MKILQFAQIFQILLQKRFEQIRHFPGRKLCGNIRNILFILPPAPSSFINIYARRIIKERPDIVRGQLLHTDHINDLLCQLPYPLPVIAQHGGSQSLNHMKRIAVRFKQSLRQFIIPAALSPLSLYHGVIQSRIGKGIGARYVSDILHRSSYPNACLLKDTGA